MRCVNLHINISHPLFFKELGIIQMEEYSQKVKVMFKTLLL